jgi:hypothetical protein
VGPQGVAPWGNLPKNTPEFWVSWPPAQAPAGEGAIRDNGAPPARQQLAVALQAASEALDGLGLALADEPEG